MSWNTPVEATTGQVVTAAFWNAQIYDNFTAAFPGGAEYEDYTPAYGFTVGNGTSVGRYGRLGKWIAVSALFTVGSSTDLSGGIFTTPPVDPASFYSGNLHVIGQAFLRDGTIDAYFGHVRTNGANIEVRALQTDGTYLEDTQISTTVPFTWAAGDKFSWHALYEGDA